MFAQGRWAVCGSLRSTAHYCRMFAREGPCKSDVLLILGELDLPNTGYRFLCYASQAPCLGVAIFREGAP